MNNSPAVLAATLALSFAALDAQAPARFSPYGTACGTDLRGADRILGAEHALTFDVTGVIRGSNAVLVLGGAATDLRLDGCRLLAQPAAVVVQPAGPNGSVRFSLTAPGSVRGSVYMQALSLDLIRRRTRASQGLQVEFVAPPPTPPAAEPVVFSQLSAGVTRATYLRDLGSVRTSGYYPASIQCPGNARYSVVWHKDANVTDWQVRTDMTDSAFDSQRDAWRRRGYVRSFVTGYDTPAGIRYNAVWVKEHIGKQRKVHRKLTRTQLDAKVAEYRVDGYSPVDILPWRASGQTYYSCVWIRDSRRFRHVASATENGWEQLHSSYRAQGYSLRDIGVVTEGRLGSRYAGVWVRDPAIATHRRYLNLTRAQLSEKIAAYKKLNYRIDDVDAHSAASAARFTLVMHQLPRRNTLRANHSLPRAVSTSLNALLDGYRQTYGNVGMYIQDLTTGKYIAYNPDEHYYLSSTRKVLIGAAALRSGLDLSRSVRLDVTDFRDTPKGGGASAGGVGYPDLNKSAVPGTFRVGQLFAAMLTGSDNTATDWFSRNWAGNSQLRAMLAGAVGTRNFGEFITKCEQDKSSLAIAWGTPLVHSVRCHVLRDHLNGGELTWANSWERSFLAVRRPGRDADDWRTHFDKLGNSITPAAYGAFFRGLASGSVLSAQRRGELLRHQGTRSSLFGRARFNSAPFEFHVAKNGSTFRNRTWAVFAFDWVGSTGDWSNITPQYSFVFLTEDHIGESRKTESDALARAIFRVAVNHLRSAR